MLRTAWISYLSSIFIILFLIINIFLFFRTLIFDDARFGWGMFTSFVSYNITYYGRDADSRIFDISLPKLVGFDAKKRVEAYKNKSGYYGEGAMIAWTKSYLKYIYKYLDLKEDYAVEAEVVYKLNRGAEQILYLKYP